MLDRSLLLPDDRAARLEQALLGTRRRLIGMSAGRHRSVRRGSSLEFADHRPYSPGDDLRRLDQHALARFDQLMIRRFDDEEAATVRLLLDTSASMVAGGKWMQAAQIAAAFGFAALLGRDSIRVHTIAVDAARRFMGASAVPSLLDHLAALPTGGRTDFDLAVSVLVAQPGPPGVTIVVSDLLSNEWARALDRLAHPRREVVVVHVLHPEELRPVLHGDLEVTDVETGERLDVTLTDRTRRAIATAADEWRAARETEVLALGHDYHLVMVGGDPMPAVLAHMTGGRERRR